MPTYSYRCTECSTAFDIQQAFTDDSLTECPKCGGRLRKLFSAVGVTFKGSGFYRNDSRSTKSSSDRPSTPSSSTGSSSDSKPAAPAAAPAAPAAKPAASSTPSSSS